MSRILIVDPDASIRALLVVLLRRGGIDSDCVGDREAAMRHVTSQRYAAVIVEPRMNGGDALLNELYTTSADGRPNIIIATTPDAGTAAFAFRAGVRTILLKPFRLEDLYETVAACCDGGELLSGAEETQRRADLVRQAVVEEDPAIGGATSL